MRPDLEVVWTGATWREIPYEPPPPEPVEDCRQIPYDGCTEGPSRRPGQFDGDFKWRVLERLTAAGPEGRTKKQLAADMGFPTERVWQYQSVNSAINNFVTAGRIENVKVPGLKQIIYRVLLALALFVVPVPDVWAQAVDIRNDPDVSQLEAGYVPGIKVSLNSHGDALQPGRGDAVAFSTFADDTRGRTRVWSQVASVSTYTAGVLTAAAKESDVNTFGGDASEPGGPRSIYGNWVTGYGTMGYLGSAALLVTSSNASRWRTGLYIDQAAVGIRLGGTFVNGLGMDLAQSRLRMARFTVPPPPPPPEAIELYAQGDGSGKLMLVVRFPSGAAVTIREP